MRELDRPIEPATALKLVSTIIGIIPTYLTQEQAEKALSHPDELRAGLRALLMPQPNATLQRDRYAVLNEIEIAPIESVDGLVLPNFYCSDGSNPCGVKIVSLGDTIRWLMGSNDPVSVPAGRVRYWRLEQYTVASQIRNTICPAWRFASFAEAAAVMSVLLMQQPKGEPGRLPTDGRHALFVFPEGVAYCRLCDEQYIEGWYVDACLYEKTLELGEGDYVISR